MDYCNSVLAGLADSKIDKLQCIQNAMARLTSRCHKFDHITPILVSLHWLLVRQHITFKVLILTYKALHDLAPPYLKSLIVPYTPIRSLCSSDSPSLIDFAPCVFSSLPLDLRHPTSLDVFKAKLETNLFKQATY